MHLSYKPPSFWRIMFRSGERLKQFSHLKKFKYLVILSGGCRTGKIIQGRKLPSALPVIGKPLLRRKGYVTGAFVHETRHMNSMYVQTVRRSMYKTRRPEYPHLPIRRYKQRPQGPTTKPRYIVPKSLKIPCQMGYLTQFYWSIFCASWEHEFNNWQCAQDILDWDNSLLTIGHQNSTSILNKFLY